MKRHDPTNQLMESQNHFLHSTLLPWIQSTHKAVNNRFVEEWHFQPLPYLLRLKKRSICPIETIECNKVECPFGYERLVNGALTSYFQPPKQLALDLANTAPTQCVVKLLGKKIGVLTQNNCKLTELHLQWRYGSTIDTSWGSSAPRIYSQWSAQFSPLS